jgi:hypothetical protein
MRRNGATPGRVDCIDQILAVARLSAQRTLSDYRAMGVAVFAVVLMCAATLAAISGQREALTRRNALARAATGEASLESVRVVRLPSSLFFVRSEIPGTFPNSLIVVPDLVDQPVGRADEQQLIRPALALDWASVIAYLFSLAALLASYDLVVEQKERGTLRLVLSYAVPRWRMLAGGVLAITGVLVAFLLLSIAVGLWMLALMSFLDLARGDVVRLVGFVAMSSAFILAMVAIGAAISTFSRHRATALAIASLFWVVSAVFVPCSAGPTAAYMHPVVSELEFQEQLRAAAVRFGARGTMSSQLLTDIVSAAAREGVATNEIAARTQDRLTREHEAGILQFKRDVIASRQAYVRQLEEQASLARRLAALSPIAAFVIASEAIADAGWPGYAQFFENARAYMLDFTKVALPWRSKLRDKAEVTYYSVEEGSLKLRGTAWVSYRHVPIDVSLLPSPNEYLARRAAIRTEVWYFLLPCIMWVLSALWTAGYALSRYDAR